jgi:tRNA modification GTPase
MISYTDDSPIAALATPPGESALALIRTSGKNTIDLLAHIFSQPQKLKKAGGNTVVLGWILGKNSVRAGGRVDQVLVSVYRAPASYTGEEGADISCHGGYATVKAVLGALHAEGFRDALPGEFTFRAFMNGKLDLTRAESVMELVSAKTDKARDRAVHRLSGALETEIRNIKDKLVQVLAGAELYLDYSEDEFMETEAGERAGILPAQDLAGEALTALRDLAASFRIENLYQEGALAVIAGRPNAGKSSLFNRLVKEDRAIVTEVPGTTRDWIEARSDIECVPLRLADTAGIRDSDNIVEKIGIERSLELIKSADVILYILDGTTNIVDEDLKFLDFVLDSGEIDGKRLVTVWNKADAAAPPPGMIGVSAKTGEGIPRLMDLLAERLTEQTDQNSQKQQKAGAERSGVASGRQKALIDKAVEYIENALDLADKRQALDIIAPALREAVNCLGEITGEVSTEDILDVMFGAFCVGK